MTKNTEAKPTPCGCSLNFAGMLSSEVKDVTGINLCKLHAEASTILNETGKTPRQLAEERAALLVALKALSSTLSAETQEMARAAIARAEGK